MKTYLFLYVALTALVIGCDEPQWKVERREDDLRRKVRDELHKEFREQEERIARLDWRLEQLQRRVENISPE